jgi:hypothetical protein
MSTAPDALNRLKARLKGLFKGKKADKPTETTKPVDTADTPTEAAAAGAATDPVAAAARKYFAVLLLMIRQSINLYLYFYSLLKTRPEMLGDCGSRLTLNYARS